MHNEFLTSTFGLVLIWISAPIFLSAISSIAAIIYFASMTKINVVDKKYNGLWGSYFKSYIGYFKKKLK